MPLKPNVKVFLMDHTIAMVTCHVKKMIITCLPKLGHLFHATIAASNEKE